MSAQHTPGPWLHQPDQEKIVSSSGQTIVYELNSSEEDARLIAAAPDLLAALEQIERLGREADGSMVDVRAMLGDIARAAIAKATKP